MSHNSNTPPEDSQLAVTTPVAPNSSPLLFVVLDCIFYVAGEKISGEVVLNLPEEIPGAALTLECRGTEEVSVYDQQARGKVKSEAMSVVFEQDMVLYEWNNAVPAGQYVFPFTVKMPDYAPATFYFSGEDSKANHIKAQISYVISSKLRVPTAETSNMTHSRVFVVRNKDHGRKPITVMESVEAIKGCCGSQGNTIIKLSMHANQHPQTESDIKYTLEPDNTHCKVPINHVTGVVTVTLSFTLPSANYTVTRNLSNVSRATWISAHTNLIYEKDFEYSCSLRLGSDDLNVSSNRTPLITCEYQLGAQIYYDIRCRSTPVVVNMPVHIDPKDTFVRSNPILPRPWDPQELSIQSFIIQSVRTSSSMALPSYPD